jgi:hypothetical protein
LTELSFEVYLSFENVDLRSSSSDANVRSGVILALAGAGREPVARRGDQSRPDRQAANKTNRKENKATKTYFCPGRKESSPPL